MYHIMQRLVNKMDGMEQRMDSQLGSDQFVLNAGDIGYVPGQIEMLESAKPSHASRH